MDTIGVSPLLIGGGLAREDDTTGNCRSGGARRPAVGSGIMSMV